MNRLSQVFSILNLFFDLLDESFDDIEIDFLTVYQNMIHLLFDDLCRRSAGSLAKLIGYPNLSAIKIAYLRAKPIFRLIRASTAWNPKNRLFVDVTIRLLDLTRRLPPAGAAGFALL